MAEQALDLRPILATLRRGRLFLVGAAVIGALVGATVVHTRPPEFVSASQVLLPPARLGDGSAARDVATELEVARSELVLGAVGRQMRPPVTPADLVDRVVVSAPTNDVIEFEVRAPTASGARELAQALADREVAHVDEAASSLSAAQQAALQGRATVLEKTLSTVNAEIRATKTRLENAAPRTVEARADATALAELSAEQANLVLQVDKVKSDLSNAAPGRAATVIQPAVLARRPSPVRTYATASGLGAGLAAAIGTMFLAIRSQRDRRLRFRDQLADAVGSPVIGSVAVRVPRDVAGWVSMLADYAPGDVTSWNLRQALRELHLRADARGRSGGSVQSGEESGVAHPASLTVISLSDDVRGMAVGPQLASYTASAGVATKVVVGKGHESGAPLWAACTSMTGRELRPLLTMAAKAGKVDRRDAFTVVLVVVDRKHPVLDGLPRTAACVVAVAAGAATSEDLARVAVRADDNRMPIDGVIVADPDDLDRTSGRLLHRERAHQVSLPGRLTGVPTAPARAVVSPFPGSRR